jgi:hypothetical protein
MYGAIPGSWAASCDVVQMSARDEGEDEMTTVPDTGENAVDLSEAARHLEMAVHDAQVSYDCVGLGHIDRAHTHAITARAAIDAAETILRAALGGAANIPADD